MRWRASTHRLHRLNTRSATTSINPKSQQTTVGATDRWTALRDAGRASTNINPRRQQDMISVTSHRTARRTSGRSRVESGRTDRGTGARALTSHLPSLLNRHRTSESQLPKTCSCYSITRLMSEGDVGCNRDGAAGQVSPVLGRYGLQHGVGRKLSCKHGGAETVASSYCTPCRQRLLTLWYFNHAGLRLVRNCSIMSREGGQTCLLPRYRFSVAASVTVMIVTSNHSSLFGSPTPRDPRSPTPWPRPCF